MSLDKFLKKSGLKLKKPKLTKNEQEEVDKRDQLPEELKKHEKAGCYSTGR